MILDNSLMFDDAVAITATRVSTNVIDLGVARDLGTLVDPLKLLIVATTTFTAAGAATMVIEFQGSVDNSTFTNYASTIALSLAQINNGLLFPIGLPRPPSGAVARPRYLRLNYTIATGPMTAGAIKSTLVLERDDIIYYPAGYSTTYV